MGRKILFTASTYIHIVNFHLPYLRKFQEEGWTVHAACGGTAADVPYADEVVDFPLKKSMWAPGNFQAAAALAKKIRREGYDLVCTHTSLAAFFTRLALRGLEERPLVVNTVHGYLFDDDSPWLKRNLLLGAERLLAADTDLVLTMNRWDHQLAEKYRLGKRVAQIPGVGVDFSRFDDTPRDSRRQLREKLSIPADAFVLICAAEFSPRKSQAVLIRAMERVPEHTVLVLAGEGTLRPECEAMVQRLGLKHRVLFPGQVRDIPAWYAMADAAVSASRSEGLPFNIMEAMYAGLPVAASDVKGHQDLIADGETGLLYPYGDEKACAEQICRLLGPESGPLRRRLAGNAREYVAQYGLERVLPVLWSEYSGLLEDRASVRK